LPLTKLTSSWQEPQAARFGFVYQALACARGLLVTGFAFQHARERTAAAVGRELDRRPVRDRIVETDNEVLAARLHAGQVGAVVQLVDEHLHIHGVAAAGIGGLGGMAHVAEFHAAAGSAVESELVMALVAALGLYDIAGYRDFGAVRHEIEDAIVILCAQVELGEVAGAVDAHAVG
jgi:hypothetical protein